MLDVRRLLQHRAAVAGGAAATVLVAALGAYALTRDGSSVSTLDTLAGPDTTAAATLDPTPSATPSASPAASTAIATPRATASWDGRADAAYDAAHPHSGLPTNCEPGHGCAYDGAHGATPAGPYGATAVVSGTSITVTWRTEGMGGGPYMGPTKEFVVDIWDRDWHHQYVRREVPLDRRSTTFTGLSLPPGGYYAWVQELNDSGLSGGVTADFDIATPPTPTPSATPEPDPTTPPPSPTPTSS